MKYQVGSPHISRTICTECNIVFANPVASFEELVAFYANYYDKGNLGALSYKERVSKKIARIYSQTRDELKEKKKRIIAHKANGHFLDIGCGLGEEMAVYHQLGFNVHGTEFDQDCINFILSLLPDANLFRGDLLQAYYPDESFDVVNICHVIEHLIDPVAYVKEIHRILKPGAILVIGTPDIGAWAYKAFRILNFLLFRIPLIVDGLEHTVIFNRANLRNLIKKQGFEIIEQYGESIEDSLGEIWTSNLTLKKKIVRYVQTFITLNQVLIARKVGH